MLKTINNTLCFQSENQWVFIRKWHAYFLSSRSEVTFILSEQERGNPDIKPRSVFMRSLLRLGGLGVVMIDWHDTVCVFRGTQERYRIVGRTGWRFFFNVWSLRIWINPQDTSPWAKILHSRISSQHQYSINDAQINRIYLLARMLSRIRICFMWKPHLETCISLLIWASIHVRPH